jgi:anti-sigma B factor antagonist
MAFELKRREREGVTIFDLSGRLLVGPSTQQLRDTLTEAIQGGSSRIILNLAGVDYIDSTGLGGMVICYTSAKNAGGSLKLLNLNKRELELMLLTKLTTVFDIFNDEQEAVNSFFPDREIKKFDILSFVRANRDDD